MMKKGFLFFCCLFSILITQAQESRFKLGLRFAPGISSTRVEDLDDSDFRSFSAGSNSLRFSAGISGDFYFGRNYAFYSGLWFTVMNAGVKGSFQDGINTGSAESSINLQYLQVPVALKLFTNEIATDIKLYFTVGGTGSVAIKKSYSESFKLDGPAAFFEKPDDPSNAYSFGDVGLLLGVGAEYRLGEATSVFGGISYNRGLLNISSDSGPIKWTNANVSDKYSVSLGIFSLEMGIYF